MLDGENGSLCTVRDIQPGKNRANVIPDGTFREVQLFGNFRIRKTLRQKAKNIQLTGAEKIRKRRNRLLLTGGKAVEKLAGHGRVYE